LESWSDATAIDGITSIVQPLIAPLYSGRSRHQLLALFLGQVASSDYDIVRKYWQDSAGWNDFEQQWRQCLNDGIVPGNVRQIIGKSTQFTPPFFSEEASNNLELDFHPDPTLWDGRFANNGWLQELPKPFTRMTWDNPALISPALAGALHLANGDIVSIQKGARTLEIPIWILPGQAKQAISVYLGSGRARAGDVGNGKGSNAYEVRTDDELWFTSSISIHKTGRHIQLASTQWHHSMQGRDPVKTRTLDEFIERKVPEAEKNERPGPDETLYDFREMLTAQHQWGMVINLNSCIGCSACVVACQAENNIPVVGKDQVWRGREMHWIRIDRYLKENRIPPNFIISRCRACTVKQRHANWFVRSKQHSTAPKG
jgi:molybdopterin-containing oxidoreductase family iron-sulfur binding subunit